jgi:ribulose-5-phosphate 4-epimerase/fuculose-1-phosphate aldolase
VRDPIGKYEGKLLRDRSATPGRIGFAAKDGRIVVGGAPDLSGLAADVLSRLPCLGMLVAAPALPFPEILLRRASGDAAAIFPLDAETRTFLRDIPLLRKADLGPDPAGRIAKLLSSRKGAIAEGIGIVASGPATLEEAYVHYSCVFHACYVKYLLDVLRDGFRLPAEEEAFRAFREEHLSPPSAEGLAFRPGPFEDPGEILAEVRDVGRYTVERSLVDSFFGNISYRAGGTIYISRTAAFLDELEGHIVQVPEGGSEGAEIGASSELPVHRGIYGATGARAILHGHPKFAVAMSMLCEEPDCPIRDCWKDCPRVRMLGDVPVVAGESGTGGIAVRVPPVIGGPGKAIVYGHGVFTVGRDGFEEAFRAMVGVEDLCRADYFLRLDERTRVQSKSE